MTAFQAVDESSILSTRTLKCLKSLFLIQMKESFKNNVPTVVSQITSTLKKEGFEAFMVGGCVRDLILDRKPKDWDITTNATPEQIISIFPKTFYENEYGTVGIVNDEVTDETLKVIETTPYRLEGKYSDKRHPDQITYGNDLKEDLRRRDFTINALAYDCEEDKIIDLYGGVDDLRKGIIRTVEVPDQRFKEDALRMLRAIRFSAELDFEIEQNTALSLVKNRGLLSFISKERIRDEFIKIILSKNPKKGLEMAKEARIMSFIIPELEETYSIGQNKAHKFDVFEHLSRTLQCAADKNFSFEVRLAALFHDIGKPRSKRWSEEKKEPTFYGHDVIGARMAKTILERLKFPKKVIDDVVKLVRWHMFFSNTEQITLSAVRRMIANVGKDYIWRLMDLRVCDRVGTGRPKENPYRLRKYKSMIEEAMHDPISVSMLKIDGKDIISLIKAQPGPRIGFILHALLEEVLENPLLNTKEYLEKRTTELNKLSTDELRKIGESGKEKKAKAEEEKIGEIRKKHWVD
jgi:tRNA nucleotidyltransferase (CCA-adding enzyme)